MDERKKTIQELEHKKREELQALNHLLQEFGEIMLQRMGDEMLFLSAQEHAEGGNIPPSITANGLASEYRKLQKELVESGEIIVKLEENTAIIKELDESISNREAECSRCEKELDESYSSLGQLLLTTGGAEEFAASFKQQEGNLLEKIDEHEQKIEALEEKKGGAFAWLSKNTQIAFSKAVLSKNRSALEKIYFNAGSQFLLSEPAEPLQGELAIASAKAAELKGLQASLTVKTAELKEERKKTADLYEAEGNPAKRIQVLERRVSQIKGEFPSVCLKFGTLIMEPGGTEALSPVITNDDNEVLSKADTIKKSIADIDLGIEKAQADISIDNEKAEIEKLRKSIVNQQQKIDAANDAIFKLNEQIADSEKRIEELADFLEKNK